MRNVAIVLGLLVSAAATVAKAEAPAVYPTAIFPFQERGIGVKGYGEKVSDILFASLVTNPELFLVDRADLQKSLSEMELNVSGLVNPAQATQVGQLTGAKILVTGSVIEVGKKVYIVAKIIGTETSRVLGESVKGNASDDLDALVEPLAQKIAGKITERAQELVAEPEKTDDIIANLKRELGEKKRPVLYVRISEHHVGQPTVDPAAQTEFILLGRETGFEVIDADEGNKRHADVIIEGEGFSEFAMRRGNLVSVKARLEMKASDPETDKVIATDRQVAVAVDLTEQVAGKTALQKAAAQIAARLLPKLVSQAE